MVRRATIPEAAKLTGLSEYFLRKGIKEGRFPHIRTGLGAGKILVDIDLLEKYLEQEAVDNVTAQKNGIDPAVINYGQLRQVKG